MKPKPNPLQDIGLLILRLGVGLIVLFYGCQKLMGVFGGPGFSGTITFFQEKYGLPVILTTLCVIAESFGALAVIFGLLTRLAAVGLAIDLGAAAYYSTRHFQAVPAVFTSGKPPEAAAFFYPLIMCIASLCLALLGSGKYALDARLFAPRKPRG